MTNVQVTTTTYRPTNQHSVNFAFGSCVVFKLSKFYFVVAETQTGHGVGQGCRNLAGQFGGAVFGSGRWFSIAVGAFEQS